jgi:hypothetical protein
MILQNFRELSCRIALGLTSLLDLHVAITAVQNNRDMPASMQCGLVFCKTPVPATEFASTATWMARDVGQLDCHFE